MSDIAVVGVVGKPHGLNGWVYVTPETDDPARFHAGSTLVTDAGPVYTVAQSRVTAEGRLVVRFSGVSDRPSAESLRGTTLGVDPGSRRTLGPDEFWPDDLEGLEVRTPDGTSLGNVVHVVLADAQNRLVVGDEGARWEIPFVSALVPEVRVEEGFLVVDPPGGLVIRRP